MDLDKKIEQIERQLSELDSRRSTLINELKLTKSQLVEEEPTFRGFPVLSTAPISNENKVNLFLKLFACRTDVYPKLWINRNNDRKGYSPACQNEWVKGICEKPQIRCGDCKRQAFNKLDESAVKAHLQGKITIVTYSIRADDSCIFLCCDFDGNGWEQDILAYRKAARRLGVETYIERSRSGAGGHAWIFFSESIRARTARQLGTLIMSKASELRHTLSLGAFDRFFPSQDTIPEGGFGNLIALPLFTAHGNMGWESESLNLKNYKSWSYSKDEIEEALEKKLELPEIETSFYMYEPGWATNIKFPVIVKRTWTADATAESGGFWKYYAVITNRGLYPLTAQDIFEFHAKRGNAENFIREEKYGYDLKHYPCQKLKANHAYGLLALVASNFLRCLQVLQNPDKPSYAKKIRHKLIAIPGKLISHSVKTIMKIPTTNYKERELMITAWRATPSPSFSSA